MVVNGTIVLAFSKTPSPTVALKICMSFLDQLLLPLPLQLISQVVHELKVLCAVDVVQELKRRPFELVQDGELIWLEAAWVLLSP